MADAIKFTEDELKNLQELQGTYQQITLALGQLSVSKYALDEREASLKQALLDTKTSENNLATSLTEKYGKGSLNIETGEFTPEDSNVEETPKETSK